MNVVMRPDNGSENSSGIAEPNGGRKEVTAGDYRTERLTNLWKI